MNGQQWMALENHCRLACETAHLRFRHLSASSSEITIVLTVNSGYE